MSKINQNEKLEANGILENEIAVRGDDQPKVESKRPEMINLK